MSDLQGRPEDVIELWTRNGACTIELLSGDITRLSQEDKVDIIMVSAFPGDYAPMSGTVIGALKRNNGINVLKLSEKKELDLRALFSCWLSKPIEEGTTPFKKLLCFERKRGSDMSVPAQISEMFRVFVPVFNNQDHTVITPLLATGHQGYNKALVCGAMVEAAIQWINAGLPLRKLKIVIYEGISKEVESTFAALKKKYMAKNAKMKDRIFKKSFDVYITYNPVDQQYMQKIKDNLEKKKTDIKLYTATKHFNQEKVWQDDIFKIMVACKRIIAILSPAFMESTECLEQYNMAMCCNRLLGVDVLAPFYVDTISSLPSYMGLVQWIDCRVRKEGDTMEGKIQTACANVIVAIQELDTVDGDSQGFPNVESSNKQSNEKYEFDVFISYSHKNPSHAKTLLEMFNKIDPTCKVFYDRSSLTTGTNWQNMLYQSVGECRCFIALMSESYLSSTICMEEFSLAQARYMCKDKDLMLVPVCIETLNQLPAHMSTVQMIKVVNDFNMEAEELARSVSEWLNLTANQRPAEYMIQDPIDIQSIVSEKRCATVRQQYRLVQMNKKEKMLERNKPLVLPKEQIEEIDASKVDIAVSYASDATHLAGSFCIMMDRLYPNFNISVHSHANQKRYSDLDTARKIVIFVSKEFLLNEHHMQELHLALNRQRPLVQNILYLIQTTPLSGRPFFPRILPYNVSCIDNVWKVFEKDFQGWNHDSDITKVSVFGKKRRLEHASTFFCRRAEYFALTKAVDDVLESLLKETDEKEKLGPMLLNVKAIEIMNGESAAQNAGIGSKKEKEQDKEADHQQTATAEVGKTDMENTTNAAGTAEINNDTTSENKTAEKSDDAVIDNGQVPQTDSDSKVKQAMSTKKKEEDVSAKNQKDDSTATNKYIKPGKSTSKSCILI